MTEGTEKATSLNLSDLSLYLHSLYHDKCYWICICTCIFQRWCPHSSVLYGLRKNVTGRGTSLEEDIKHGFLSNPAPQNPDYHQGSYLHFSSLLDAPACQKRYLCFWHIRCFSKQIACPVSFAWFLPRSDLRSKPTTTVLHVRNM